MEKDKVAAETRKKADADATRARIAGDKAINAALRQTAQDEIRLAREVARENKQLDKEWRARLKSNAQETRAERKLQALEEKAYHKEQKESWLGTGSAIGLAKNALTSFAGQFAGVITVSKAIGEVEAGFQRTRDAIFNSTELLGEFRVQLLELAALKDHPGDTTQEAIETLRFQAKTGLKTADAVGLQGGFKGVAESVVGPKGNITQENADKAMAQVGVLAAVKGGGAKEWGEMAGMIAQVKKPANGKQLTGDELADETARAEIMQRPGKFGGISAFSKQFAKGQPLVQTGIVSERQMLGLVGAMGVVDAETAGEDAKRLVMMAMGGSTKDAHGRIIPMKGVAAESQAAYQKRLGVTEDMDFAQRLKLMGADFKKAEAETKAKGEAFNPIAYAKTKGMNNKGDLDTFLKFSGLVESGQYKKFEDMQNDPNLGKDEIAKAKGAQAVDQGLQHQMIKAGGEVAKMAPGIPFQTMRNARETAYNELFAEGKVTAPHFGDLETRAWYGPTNLMQTLMGNSEQAAVKQRANQNIMGAATKFGVPFKATDSFGTDRTAGTGRQISDDEAERVTRELQSRGWSPAGESNAKITEAAVMQLEAAKIIFKAAQVQANPRPPAMQGRPNQPPAFPFGGTLY